MDLSGIVKQRKADEPVLSEVVTMSPLKRDFDASRVNPIINHPQVRPWMGGDPNSMLDMSGLVDDLRNILLMTDHGGLLFHCLEPGTYEVHTNFLPVLQGAQKLAVCREALHWMFTRTDCVGVVTRVPQDNRAALGMVRAVHMAHEFDREETAFYSLRYWPWLWSDGSVAERGKWFHDRLALEKARMNSVDPPHADDPAHDYVVGAAIDQVFAGQIHKAIGFYNHWARIAGYRPIGDEDIKSVNPLVLDIGDAIVAFHRDDIEVIKCRSEQQ